jgi:hypothetical protein
LSTTSAPADDTSTSKDSTDKINRREPTRFIRVRYDEFKRPVALQTASAKYILPGPDGKNQLEIVLEGVIHVGDRSYYREFNRRFRHYDAVLYELIASPQKLIPNSDDKRPHPLRILQQVTAEGLGFASQINEIDYKAPNMVHSDLSPSELARIAKVRGDDQVTILLEMFTDILRKTNIRDNEARETQEDSDAASDPDASDPDSSDADPSDPDSSDPDSSDPDSSDPEPSDPEPSDDEGDSPFNDIQSRLKDSLRLLADPDGAVKIRRILATGFDKAPSLEAMLRPSQLATLIKARNVRALEVFQEQLDDGKRHIAFFWGAGHMADFERQLVLNYGVQPAGIVWRDAWDLRDGAVEFSPLESILERSLRGSLKDALRGLLGDEP